MPAHAPAGLAPSPKWKAFGHGVAHHQHLAHGLRGDQAEQAAISIHNADRRSGLLQEDAEGLIEATAMIDGRNLARHDIADQCVGSVLLQRLDHVAAAEHANKAAILIHHRKFVLACPQEGLDRLLDAGRGRELLNFGHHGSA